MEKDNQETPIYKSIQSLSEETFLDGLQTKKSFEILNGFTEAGFNFIDTADVYSRWKPGNSGGESEKIIGNWMKEKKNRHDIILTTKVGSDMGDGKKD